MFKQIFSRLILLSILLTGPVFAKKEANKIKEVKATETKAVETKPTDSKVAETKTSGAKPTEANVTESKVTETKVAGVSVIGAKGTEAKEPGSKVTEEEEDEIKPIAANATAVTAAAATILKVTNDEEKVAPNATETFKSGPLTEDDVISMLKEKHKGSVVGVFMDSYPRLIKVTVRATMDENIKKLWGDTLKDRTRYYLLIGFFLITVLVNWFWKRDQIRSDNSLPKRILGFFYRFFLINIARVGFFIFLFPNEIYPVWVIFRKIFFP